MTIPRGSTKATWSPSTSSWPNLMKSIDPEKGRRESKAKIGTRRILPTSRARLIRAASDQTGSRTWRSIRPTPQMKSFIRWATLIHVTLKRWESRGSCSTKSKSKAYPTTSATRNTWTSSKKSRTSCRVWILESEIKVRARVSQGPGHLSKTWPSSMTIRSSIFKIKSKTVYYRPIEMFRRRTIFSRIKIWHSRRRFQPSDWIKRLLR